jgi:glycosyltransferase involved in cell wall biosynthesis
VEACPNIVLEAMSYECISISADNPPLPEIFGDVAVYYPSKKTNVLAMRIGDVLNYNEEKRQILREKSLFRINQFS